MAKKDKDKLYIVRFYVRAMNAVEAIKKVKNKNPDDVWVDDEWKKAQNNNLADAIGFEVESTEEQTDDNSLHK